MSELPKEASGFKIFIFETMNKEAADNWSIFGDAKKRHRKREIAKTPANKGLSAIANKAVTSQRGDCFVSTTVDYSGGGEVPTVIDKISRKEFNLRL